MTTGSVWTYSHTQIGWVILGSVGVAFVVAAFMLTTRAIESPVGFIVIVFALVALGASLILFSTLTIRVSRDTLAWSFGPGLIRKAVRVPEIVEARVVKNAWIYGWGIHLTPHGWLYNVSGRRAIEIGLQGGKRFRLGSDEPEALLRALQTVTDLGVR